MFARLALFFVIVFAVMQCFRPAKNVMTGPAAADDFLVRHTPPPAVRQVLTVACYDCHSNHTRYPWYAEFQPLGWWLAQHVDDGKRDLNFSELGGASDKKQAKRIEAMIDEINDGHMPLPSYTWTHADARLDAAQKTQLTAWLKQIATKLAPEE